MADQRSPWMVIFESATMLLAVGVQVWVIMPPQERLWVKLHTLHSLHQLSARLALRAGHKAMSDELAGVENHRYAMAYRLSQLRDRLGSSLEGMKP